MVLVMVVVGLFFCGVFLWYEVLVIRIGWDWIKRSYSYGQVVRMVVMDVGKVVLYVSYVVLLEVLKEQFLIMRLLVEIMCDMNK